MGQLEPHVPIYVIVVYVYEPSCDYQTAGAERSIGAMRERAAHPMLLASTWHTSRQGCTEETLQPPAHNFFPATTPFPFHRSPSPRGRRVLPLEDPCAIWKAAVDLSPSAAHSVGSVTIRSNSIHYYLK